MDGSLNFDILTKTFDDLPVGVGIFEVTDLNDIESIRYVFMNKVLLYEMRKNREEVFGKLIIEVAPEAYAHAGGLHVIETYRKVAAEGGSVNLGLVEYSNHMVAGTYECSVHHIEANYVYVMLRNVTELEQAKNDLEAKNKDLSNFAHMVSHDLKDPLNTISSIIELVKMQFHEQLGEEGSKLVDFIFDSAGRMRNLINDILDFSSIGQRKEMTKIDCNELLDIIQQDLKSRIKDTNTSIEVAKLPEINGYRTEIRLLFQNLVSNGIKFNRPGVKPKIKISAKEEDGWTFSIEDNGIGIAPEFQEKIFGIFQRLHDRSEYEGTGIGLAHCKKIIDLHKGRIWVDSAEGKGSIFNFTIPK